VTVDTGVLLHLDLGWPDFKVRLEYDGQWHASTDQFHRDRRRLNLLQGAGWIVLHATSERLSRDFAGLVREIRAALASRGWRARSAS
jgi:very-short-patch-repair endonuclease